MFRQAELETTLSSISGVTHVHYYPTLGSSNTVLKAFADDGAAHGTLVVADEQTAGRGRQGRNWATPAGTAIAVSMLLRPDANDFQPAQYSLLGGLAAAQAIQTTVGTVDPKVKWPNDVWINDQKVCGVLAEAGWKGTALDYVVVGIGINVNGTRAQLGETRTPATTLETITGSPQNRLALLQSLVTNVFTYAATPFERVLAQINTTLLWRGEQVTLTMDETPSVTGVLQGVSETGAVKIDDAAFYVGELRNT